MRFPLWAKLGLVFGGMLGVFMGGYGWLSFQADIEADRVRQRAKLQGLARSLAAAVDGDAHATLRASADMERPAYAELRALLQVVDEANQLAWVGTAGTDDKGRFFFVGDGTNERPFPIGLPIFDGAELRRAALAKEVAYTPALEDEWGTWEIAAAPIRDRAGRAVGVLEVAVDADQRLLNERSRRDRLLLQILLAVGGAALAAVAFARWLNRHLRTLTDSALHVAAGQLDREVHITTRDEIGVLGGAFNSMVTGLREREHIRATFGRYVSSEIASKILGDDDPHLGGEERVVTVLMSDLRGFTSLSEQLGPRRMVALLNRYFGRMAEVIHTHRGTIGELVGDGMVVYFGTPETAPDDAVRAVACAVAMEQALRLFNTDGEIDLEMGIGIATGRVIAGNIGSERRMKYGVVGNTINLAARLEAFTLGNQVLIDDATLSACGDNVRVGKALTLRAKGKRHPVNCHPVKETFGRWSAQMPKTDATFTVPVDLPVTCAAIIGKEIATETQPARVTRLGKKRAVLTAAWPAEPRGSFRLCLDLGGGVEAGNIYARVIASEPLTPGQHRLDMAITSIPARERELLANLMAPI